MTVSVRDLAATGPRGLSLLSGVSFDVAAGETLALLGASGSGKSLTGRALLSLPPIGVRYGGAVMLDGTDLLRCPEPALRRLRGAAVSMVFQEPATALNPAQRIGAQIDEPMRLHTRWGRAQRTQRVRDLLDDTGLTAAGVGPERYPHELSGGQRQRVAIAIAMALSPKLVVADEPTSALDSVSAARVLDLLFDMAKKDGVALVLITHDLAVAARADRIAVMEEGRVVETTPATTLLSGPKSEAGRKLLVPPPRVPASPPADELLAVNGLSAHVVGRALVQDVSMTVRRGERIAIVGASGSGKTSLARALLGLVPATGDVRLAGQTVARRDLRREVAMVFQDPAESFNPRHSVERAVTEPIYTRPRAERHARAIAAIDAVGLSADMLSRRPHAFSGGQRQRLAIARALIGNPQVLLADEAVSALDAALRTQVVELLASLTAERGMGLIFISHDLGLVRRLAHRVLVMDHGQVVEEATPDDLERAPRHRASLALIAAATDRSATSLLQANEHPATQTAHDGA